MVAAATGLVYEHGARAATVSEIVHRAGISRRSFYEIFPNAERCLLAALEEALQRAQQRVIAAQQGAREGWIAQTRAGLAALLAFFDESPQAAHLLVVESLLAGPQALRRREQVLCELAAAVQRAQAAGGCKPGSPELGGEALVGAALAVVHRRLLHDAQRRRNDGVRACAVDAPAPPVGRLIELTGPLMSMVVLPYLGAAAARRELMRTPSRPAAPDGPPSAVEGALGSPGIRLTNRTILALSAIGRMGHEETGPSNRQIAVAAGISDQGQASKLLARLCRHGLIENSGWRPHPYVNAWKLTVKGEAIVRSLPEAA